MGSFDDKIVWITGGGSGIGHACALEFARQGAHVAVSGRRADRLAEVVAAVEALGRRALAVPCDVADEAAVSAAVDTVVGHFGALHVAFANAGFGVAGRVEKLTADEWRRQLDVNVVGAAITCRHALPHLRAHGGRLAITGSVAGEICTPGMAAYSASKFAVRALSLTLSQELHGSGVSCTLVEPGFVESEIAQVDNAGHFDAGRKDRRPQKLMWTAERAARVIVTGIARRKRVLVFTGHGKVGAWLGRHFPGFVHFAVTRFGSSQGSRPAPLPDGPA